MAAKATTHDAINPRIGLIVTGAETLCDFQIFVKTLAMWHTDAELFVFTDTATESHIKAIKTPIKIHTRPTLTKYSDKDRKTMEAMSGEVYATLWTDFMYEKAAVLQWIFEIYPTLAEGSGAGAWFMDADITFLAPIQAPPAWATVALSPHYIRTADEMRFGKYNGGYLWIKDQSLLEVWRVAGHSSHFYEQSALEAVSCAAAGGLFEFPIQVNFGWWRMFQSSDAPPVIQSRFRFNRFDKSIGLRYDDVPLQSIHTHWRDNTSVTGMFNLWIDTFTGRIASVSKTAKTWRGHVGMGR